MITFTRFRLICYSFRNEYADNQYDDAPLMLADVYYISFLGLSDSIFASTSVAHSKSFFLPILDRKSVV